MYYSQSIPWVLKVAMLALSLVRTSSVQRPLSVSTRDLALLLALACCLAGAVLLHSLCYSVRQRAATTTLAVQTMIMPSLTTALVSTIHGSSQLGNYSSLAMQFLSCHIFYVLRYVAVSCSVLQCVAVCCSVLQCVAVCCSVLQCVAVCCSVLRYVAVCCSVLQCVAVCCSVCETNMSSNVVMTHV